MTLDEIKRLLRALQACSVERTALIGQPYTTAASRRVEEIDEIEDGIWDRLEQEAVSP